MAWDPKDPEDLLDYDFTWRLDDGETITDADWTVLNGGAAGDLAIAADPAPGIDGARTYVWLEGGLAGKVYDVEVQITTSPLGRVYNRKAQLTVQDR